MALKSTAGLSSMNSIGTYHPSIESSGENRASIDAPRDRLVRGVKSMGGNLIRLAIGTPLAGCAASIPFGMFWFAGKPDLMMIRILGEVGMLFGVFDGIFGTYVDGLESGKEVGIPKEKTIGLLSRFGRNSHDDFSVLHSPWNLASYASPFIGMIGEGLNVPLFWYKSWTAVGALIGGLGLEKIGLLMTGNSPEPDPWPMTYVPDTLRESSQNLRTNAVQYFAGTAAILGLSVLSAAAFLSLPLAIPVAFIAGTIAGHDEEHPRDIGPALRDLIYEKTGSRVASRLTGATLGGAADCLAGGIRTATELVGCAAQAGGRTFYQIGKWMVQ